MFEFAMERWRLEILEKGKYEMTEDDLALIENHVKDLEEENLKLSTEISMIL